MKKMGTYKGLPVYLLMYSNEYQALESNEEKFFVAEGVLFYKGVRLGVVKGNQLYDFDEAKFNELRAKGWYKDGADLLAKVTATAETRPQEEEKPEYEVPETDCGKSLVDDFMASWRDNIDSEVAKLQASLKVMEEEIRARY